MATSHSFNPSGGASATDLDPMSGILARNWWAVALRGVLGIVFGIIAFLLPGVTMLSLAYVFAAYAVVDGVFAIVAAVRAAGDHRSWGWFVFEGIAGILAGVAVALWPGISVGAFVFLVACWAIVTGVLMFGSAFTTKVSGRWWLGLGGALSVIFGVLLVAAPLMGALVLTWWIGAYSMAFGIALLVMSFRLRSQN
jgi:uncharacterized membrane protein HdeD (DUF308 family)